MTMQFRTLLSLLPALAVMGACEDFGGPHVDEGRGVLRWTIDPDASAFTKAGAEIPDTNDFLLTISDENGNVLYTGSYGASPEELSVEAGSYLVSIRSVDFTTPAFDMPQYGDEQVVVVGAGQRVTVRLCCTLCNAGMRLRTDSNFLTSYPDGVLYLKNDQARLMYGYRENRIAYFRPGAVSVTLYNHGQDQTLLTRTLAPQEILTLSISAPSPAQAGPDIQVAVDTSKNWITDSFVIGGSSGGSGQGTDPSNAYSVADAPAHVGEQDVWFSGYVVGGDLTAAGKTVKTSGIIKDTHLALAVRSSVTAKESCLAVELPKGAVRDALNLVSHPELIGSRICVRGDVTASYFGTTGLKSTSEYALK